MPLFSHHLSRVGEYMIAGGSTRVHVTESAAGTAADSLAAYALAKKLVSAPMSDERKTAILAEARVVSSADFIDRIPAATWAKVQAVAAPQTNPSLAKALYRLAAGTEVHSDNPQLLGMLAQLVSAGVLTSAESVQILSF